MLRLRIVRPYKSFVPGEIVYPNEKYAEFLLKNGYAIQSKDMTAVDYQQKDLNGNSSRQRTN